MCMQRTAYVHAEDGVCACRGRRMCMQRTAYVHAEDGVGVCVQRLCWDQAVFLELFGLN